MSTIPRRTFLCDIPITEEEKNNLIEKLRGKSLADEHPDLVKEWHPTKNGNWTPQMVTAGSGRKIYWYLPYDVPMDYPIEHLRGKHFDFEWGALISDRIKKNCNCPYLSGRAIWRGFNDLTTTHPEIAKEWHPTKNGNTTPNMVTAGSNKKVWWYLPYNVPMDYPIEHLRGKHFDFEWEASCNSRILQNQGCPFLSNFNARVWPGFNDLATTHTKLAAQWHPAKNGNLTPKMVSAGSGKKVWWYQPYDDPKTGKHFDFEWEDYCFARVTYDGSCPFLTDHRIYPGFNDLATTHPKLAAEWHPTKNGTLTPKQITAGSHKKVWWYLPYADPKTGKRFDFEWESSVCNRASQNLCCPFLAKSNVRVWTGYNDLITTHPELAAEWHPTQNGKLTPQIVTAGSQKRVWWKCGHGHEWQTTVSHRSMGSNCPICSESKGETAITLLLTRFNIKFITQKTFKECKSKNPLPFDVAIDFNDKLILLIEYDGKQHYKPIDFAGKGKIHATQQLNKIKKRDKIKNQYCRDNNIPLLRIPYWEFDNINKIVLKTLFRYGLLNNETEALNLPQAS